MATGVIQPKIKTYTFTLVKAQYSSAGVISLTNASSPDGEIYISNGNEIHFLKPRKILAFLDIAGQVVAGNRYALQIRINNEQKTALLNYTPNSNYFASSVSGIYDVTPTDVMTVLTAETVGVSSGYPDGTSTITLVIF